jgi:hypothetical protein
MDVTFAASGYHHWMEDAARSREFEDLATFADQLIDGDPDVTREEVEEEANKLGTPNQLGVTGCAL